MMLLAIDTTAATATAALFRNGTLIAEREADASKKHAETILPLIDALLEENGVTIAQVDRFAVDIGPGSFTGVRIGVSLIDARNGNAYAALYQAGKTIIEPCAVEIEPFCAKLPEDTILVGDVKAEQKTVPRAALVGLAAMCLDAQTVTEAEPLYLRPSQAERTKKQSAKEA